MSCVRSMLFVATSAVVLTATLSAQRGASPDEFLELEPVLQAALRRAAPFTVAVETFGGTRQPQGKDGPMDGEMPPQPRQAPKPKPEPKPDEPAPDDEKKDEKKDEAEPKKPKKPLVAGGFQQTLGKTTGIVLSSDGWILVSRFALALEPTTILITVPDRGTFHAQRAGEDTSRGIALVKIEAQDLPVPDFVDPAEVRVGQWAFALGRTFANDEPTVHFGIVSAKNRLFGRSLQIDAYTSPANYGGPVVDVRGRVLGMAVPLSPNGRNAGVEWYDSGIGFATTIKGIEPLIERMKQGQALQRAWLGVQFSPSHLGPGALIAGTPKDGPAASAQTPLRKGDIIVAVDGVQVKNGPHCMMLVSSRLGGDKVLLTVTRDGAELPAQEIELKNAPWSEQQRSKDADLPASFPLPEKNEGR